MKRFLSFFLILNIFLTTKAQSPIDYVNPLMGTQSTFSLSNGNTYPAIGRPWGMHYWSPQTGKNGDGWMYTYAGEKIRGFKQTHQPSPWMNDYGQFSIMPVTGKKKFREEQRQSLFSHKTEIATPAQYRVYLAEFDVQASFTATERSAIFNFIFPKNDSSFIVVDAFDKGSFIQVFPEQQKIIGYSTKNSGGVHQNFKNYFVMTFSKPFRTAEVWKDSTIVAGTSLTSNHSGAIVGFSTQKDELIEVKIASSFISPEQAELNLKNEIGTKQFADIVQESKRSWNETLGRLSVKGGTEDQKKTFYSCLYRTVCFPQKQYEIDQQGKIVHYSPYTGNVQDGYFYAGTGFWDTFRALYPLLNLVYPSINKEMQEGLLNCYKEGGFLPEWSSPGYRDVMVGNNSAAVVADAYIKGLRGYDIETLYKALQHGAENEGPSATGRKGVSYYNQLGYVPYDVKINENAARTLEYAYDDFAIWKLAKALNRPATEIALYEKRMLNYKNLFDPETKLMRGKLQNGAFMKPFNPFKWGDAFTEGNSWHYSWSVFHDIQGLIDLMGGKKIFVSMLDSVFKLPPVFDDTYYGYPIHEIREMQAIQFGQYAHGNQPIQHMIYLYNYAGEPWKTQYWAREVMDRLYKPTPDGYCGDEDNGQTSAWYIFSSMGFYPVCPATDEYVLGAPAFPQIDVKLENGKTLSILGKNEPTKNRYVKSLYRNGMVHTKNYVNHSNLLKGGTLVFEMQATPNTQRGTQAKDYPYSYSTQK